jgi:hypothetical protein
MSTPTEVKSASHVTVHAPWGVAVRIVLKIALVVAVLMFWQTLRRTSADGSSAVLGWVVYAAAFGTLVVVFRETFSVRIGSEGIGRGRWSALVKWTDISSVSAEKVPLAGRAYMIRSATRQTMPVLWEVAAMDSFRRALSSWSPDGHAVRVMLSDAQNGTDSAGERPDPV